MTRKRWWYRPGRPAAGRRTRPRCLLLLAALIYMPVGAISSPPAAVPAERTWPPAPVYQQIGPSCVGYALAAWLDAAPAPVLNHASGWAIYQAAVEQDGITGPHVGTTVPAGLAVLTRLGYVRDWRGTADAAVALRFLRTDGPLVISGAFPDELPVFDSAHNLVWTGRLIQHAWLCYSVDARDRLGCQDSAGTQWNPAEGGRFHMTRAALAAVLTSGRAWLIHKAAR